MYISSSFTTWYSVILEYLLSSAFHSERQISSGWGIGIPIESALVGTKNEDCDGDDNVDDDSVEEQLCHEAGVGRSRPLAA